MRCVLVLGVRSYICYFSFVDLEYFTTSLMVLKTYYLYFLLLKYKTSWAAKNFKVCQKYCTLMNNSFDGKFFTQHFIII